MGTPLNIALDIGRLINEARASGRPLDLAASAGELFLRFFGSGCSRRQIAEALTEEAQAAGVMIR